MENTELIIFEIISKVGVARSKYIEAISYAKDYNFETAENLIKEGSEIFLDSHKIHANLVQKEANGEKVEVSILLVHAEDQLMSAESFKILSNEFIQSYKKMFNIENKVK